MKLLVVDGLTANIHARNKIWLDLVKLAADYDRAYYFIPDKADRDYSKFFRYIYPPYRIFHEAADDDHSIASVTACLLCKLTIEMLQLQNIRHVTFLTDNEIFRPLIEHFLRKVPVALATNNWKLASMTNDIIPLADIPTIKRPEQ